MAIAFDTLKLAQRLEAAGMPQSQAQGMATALAETITGDLVTREHLDLRLGEMEAHRREMEERLLRRIDQIVIRLGALIVALAGLIIGAVAALFHLMH